MNLKYSIGGLVTSLGLGVSIGFAVHGSNKEMKVAEAADPVAIYCKCEQSWWKADGAAVGIYAFGGTGPAFTWPGARMTAVNNEYDNDVWVYNLDITQYTGVIFTRINSSGTVADWGAKTADLTLSNSNNLYTITSTSAVWGDPGVAGKWSSGYDPGFHVYVNGAGKTLMTKNNGSEVTANVSVSANDTLSFDKNGTAYAATGKYEGQNNVTTDLHVKTGGSISLYLNHTNGQLWATGFASTTSYIYYISAESYPTTNHIYSFDGEKQFGQSDAGKSITSISGYKQLSTVLNFNGEAGYIYRIPIKNTDYTFQLVSNDKSARTGNLTLTLHTAYWWQSTPGNGNADAALALDLIDRVEDARNAASYTKSAVTLNYSICGIAPATAGALWEEYYGLNETAKAYVDATTTYTWKDASSNASSNQKNWTYAEIMLQLKEIAKNAGISVSGMKSPLNAVNEDTAAAAPVMIATTGVITLTTVGGYFFIKKKPF